MNTDEAKLRTTPQPPTWKEQGYFPARYFVAVMSFLGQVFFYMLRININFTIVAMVKTENSTDNDSLSDPCNYGDAASESEAYNGNLDWDEITQSLVIGAFYWGYIFTQIPGGRLAERIGPKRVYGCAILGSAFFTLFIPVASNSSAGAAIAVRILMGLSQGPCFPSTHALLSIWAPPQERSFISTIIYAGAQAGTIIAYPLAAVIINNISWEAVYYIQAGMTMVWAAAWFLLVSEKPESFRWISEAEKNYIKESIGPSKDEKSPPVPWKSIITSVPFWAIVIAGFGNNWGFYTLVTDLPLYMKNMMRQDINANALLSGMPYLGMWIFSLLFSSFGDYMIRHKYINTTWLRKIATLIAHAGPAICLFSLSAVECDRTGTIALLFTAVLLQGGIYTGWMINHIDIAPNFAGTLFGITNGIASIPAWVAPLVVGAFTNNNQTFEQWEKIFYIAGGMYLMDSIIFFIFSSGVEQEWNKVLEKDWKKSDEPEPDWKELEFEEEPTRSQDNKGFTED